MRSPNKSICCYVWIAIVVLVANQPLLAQSDNEQPLSPEKQKLLKERDRMIAEINKLFRAREYAKGMAIGERVLDVHFLNLPPVLILV